MFQHVNKSDVLETFFAGTTYLCSIMVQTRNIWGTDEIKIRGQRKTGTQKILTANKLNIPVVTTETGADPPV